MTRHSKNCSAGAVYTYHERQKDTGSCGYRTQRTRISKNSAKEFNCCCLTLQPCRNPVIIPDGYLFDKEAILEYIVHQKTEIARETKKYFQQKRKDLEEMAELAAAEEEARVKKFIEIEENIVRKPGGSLEESSKSEKVSISNMANGNDKKLPSFWIPSLTPSCSKVKLKKPEKRVLCPMSGRPLKAKDLIPVKFTEISNRDDKRALIAWKCRYMCPVTHDVLGNSVSSAILRTSGSVVTMECVEKLIKKDMIDPTNGKKLSDDDIIPLKRGGTGYASTNEKLNAKKKTPAVM